MNTCFRVTERHVVYDYFEHHLGISYTEDFRGCLFTPKARIGKDVVVAVAYNAFNGHTCTMHTVIEDPTYVSRPIVQEVFEFPFIACGMNHVIAMVESENRAALDFDKRLGFHEVHRFKEGANDGDLVVLTMAKEECRWIGRRTHNGQKQQSAPARLRAASASDHAVQSRDTRSADQGQSA